MNPAFLFHVKHFLSSFQKDAPGGLRRRLRDVEVRDELFDVGQFLVEIFAALLLFPVAREFLQRKDRTVYTIFKTMPLFFEQISPGMNKTSFSQKYNEAVRRCVETCLHQKVTTWGTVCLFRYSLKFELLKTIYLALLIWQSFECLTRQERLFYLYKALTISFLRQCHKLKILNSTLLGLSNQIYCFKTKRYSFTHYAWLLICWMKVIPPPSPHSPLDTCCTFLIFGPPLSVKYKAQM